MIDMMKTTRTMATAMLAGTMVLGMSACTKVEGTASKASSAAADGASSAGAAASSAASQASSAMPSDQSSASSAAADASEASTPSDTPTDAATDDSGDASGPKPGKVGEEVKTAEMSAKVNKISDPVQADNDYSKPDAGKHYVAVNVTMTNVGSKELNAGETCLKVKLDDNTSAQEDFASYGQRLDYGTLYKGDTTTGDVLYQVTNGHKIKTIDIKCGYGDEQAIRISAN